MSLNVLSTSFLPRDFQTKRADIDCRSLRILRVKVDDPIRSLHRLSIVRNVKSASLQGLVGAPQDVWTCIISFVCERSIRQFLSVSKGIQIYTWRAFRAECYKKFPGAVNWVGSWQRDKAMNHCAQTMVEWITARQSDFGTISRQVRNLCCMSQNILDQQDLDLVSIFDWLRELQPSPLAEPESPLFQDIQEGPFAYRSKALVIRKWLRAEGAKCMILREHIDLIYAQGKGFPREILYCEWEEEAIIACAALFVTPKTDPELGRLLFEKMKMKTSRESFLASMRPFIESLERYDAQEKIQKTLIESPEFLRKMVHSLNRAISERNQGMTRAIFKIFDDCFQIKQPNRQPLHKISSLLQHFLLARIGQFSRVLLHYPNQSIDRTARIRNPGTEPCL